MKSVNKAMKANSLNRCSVPEDFTLSMALVDTLPVLFFCASTVVLTTKFDSLLFKIGAICCITAGCGKALWKFLIAAAKKNSWLLNRQMRFLMPAGFVLITLSLIIDRNQINFAAVWNSLISFPSVIFFGACIVGIIAMGCFAAMLDGSKTRSNWIEQITNTIAQACLLVGLLFLW
jgi:hypothetical protein